MPDYVNVPELTYNWVVAVFFFLSGLASGAYLFSIVAYYWKKELRSLAKAPAIIAPIAIAIGMLMMLHHLGQPFRAYLLLIAPNPTSGLSWGVWSLNILFALSAFHAWQVIKGQTTSLGKFAATVGFPVALVVAAYTGILLTMSPGRPLWHTPLVPVLFINGGLICGLAFTLLAAGSKAAELRAKVAKYLIFLVLAELVIIIIELITLFSAGGGYASAARCLLGGEFSLLFVGLEIVLGIIIPVGILALCKARFGAQALASVLVLIGVLAMRIVVVIGGQVIQ